MKARENAKKGLALIKKSIVDYLKKNKARVRGCEVARDLGLQTDPSKFTRTLTWALLELLADEGRIHSTGKRSTKRYFPLEQRG